MVVITTIALLSSCRTTHYIPLPSFHHRDSLVTRVNTRVDSIYEGHFRQEKQPVIIVLTSRMYKRIPAKYKEALDEGQLLIISLRSEKIARGSKATAPPLPHHRRT